MLASRHLATLLVAALLPLVAFSVVMLTLFERQQHHTMVETLLDAAASAGHAVENRITREMAILDTISATEDLSSSAASPATLGQLRAIAARQGWLCLMLTDNARTLVDTCQIYGEPVDGEEMAEAFAKGQPSVSKLIHSGAYSEPAVIVRIPLLRDGVVDRSLGAVIPAVRFAGPLRQSGLPKGWTSVLVDDDGSIIARTGPRATGTLSPAYLEALHSDREGVFEAEAVDGRASYCVIGHVGVYEGYVLVAAPKDLVNAPYAFANRAAWVGGAAALALAAVLIWAFLRLAARLHRAGRDRAMAELGNRLANIAAGLPGVIYRRELTPGGVLRYTFFSARAAELFGQDATDLQPQEVLLDDAASHVAEEDRERWLASIRHSAATLEPFIFTGRLDGANQSRWVRSTANAHRRADGTVVWDGVVLDVTEQHEAEMALCESRTQLEHALAEARSAGAMKAKFLATASHDLRQPIQSLLLFSHALAAKLRGHEARRVAEKMIATLDTLKSMLDNLLDLSKIEAGLVEPELTAFELKHFRQIGETFEPRIAAAGLRFRYVGCGNGWVRSDPALLAQIVGNLLDNALKYTRRGGGVLLGCRKRQGFVRVQVVDSGVGIAAEHLGAIFEEFVQVGDAGREHRQGLGLGLATVKALCDLLGHRLTVSSRLGHGTVFSLDIPTVPRPPVVLEAKRHEAVPAVLYRILVIDDEVFIREGMRAMLETWGHQVLAAASLAEAKQVIEAEGTPDLVLADYRLGADETGVQAIEQIRAQIGPVPAAIITGDTEVAKTVPRAAKVAVLHKPLGTEELRRVIQRLAAKAG